MKTPLLHGIGIAFAGAVFALILHLLGITTNPENLFLAMAIGFPVGLAIFITGLILGTKRARAEQGADGFSYGQAFTTGLLITLFAAAGGVLFNLIYYGFIFANFAEVTVESTRALLEKLGAREADIERAIEDIRTKSTLTRQVVSAFIGSLVMGTIVSLITAAVMKRPPADAPGELPPSLA